MVVSTLVKPRPTRCWRPRVRSGWATTFAAAWCVDPFASPAVDQRALNAARRSVTLWPPSRKKNVTRIFARRTKPNRSFDTRRLSCEVTLTLIDPGFTHPLGPTRLIVVLPIVTWLGHSNGLALSLAGAVGIIVSVGVTVDSYVVYFERLKDEIRSGKTIRSSVDRGFSRAYRTILAADLVSLIGAALLYWLAVGSVRGFAFFLGLSTLLDVFVAYFFMHPLVSIIGRKESFTRAGWLGIASGLDAKGATA